jgi:hypothetical protein
VTGFGAGANFVLVFQAKRLEACHESPAVPAGFAAWGTLRIGGTGFNPATGSSAWTNCAVSVASITAKPKLVER